MSGTTRHLTVTLDGTNKSTTLPLIGGTIGPEVADIRKLYADLGVFTYDPGYGGTAACDSKITYIDGDEGVLLHRGYPIEQLADAFQLPRSGLPPAVWRAARSAAAGGDISSVGSIHMHTMVHEQLRSVLQRLPARRASDGGDVWRGWRNVVPSTTTVFT